MSKKLRVLVEEITRDGSSADTHPAKLGAISNEAPHSIHVLPTPFEEPLGDFNCVMHALGLIGRIENPCRPLGHFYADTGFLRSLIGRAILKSCIEANGALVVWSSAGTMKHVGIVVAPGRAASKWGIGYVYEHDFLEVPESYGDELTFYGVIDSDDALNRLREYHARGRR